MADGGATSTAPESAVVIGIDAAWQSGWLALVAVGQGHGGGGAQAHQAFQTGRHDLRPPPDRAHICSSKAGAAPSGSSGQSDGRSAFGIAHVAKDLGIHKGALRGWVRQAEADRGERDDRLTTTEQDELRQLRRENAELRRANEILKAASVFFAQETDCPRTRPSR
ncbi:transposase [Streptomyces sp. NBC_00448]|uniref:transposase n=1 Tax=Streptomyces sp. NBC_00448 TaxID=2903652 RepID=UPI002E1A4856